MKKMVEIIDAKLVGFTLSQEYPKVSFKQNVLIELESSDNVGFRLHLYDCSNLGIKEIVCGGRVSVFIHNIEEYGWERSRFLIKVRESDFYCSNYFLTKYDCSHPVYRLDLTKAIHQKVPKKSGHIQFNLMSVRRGLGDRFVCQIVLGKDTAYDQMLVVLCEDIAETVVCDFSLGYVYSIVQTAKVRIGEENWIKVVDVASDGYRLLCKNIHFSTILEGDYREEIARFMRLDDSES